MPQFDGLISLLDSRSFGTWWYWLIVIGIWSDNSRKVVGVPAEVLSNARRSSSKNGADGPAVLTLLDWLSLTLPRWRLRPPMGVIYMGMGAFALTFMAFMGFGYDLEMAQAVTFILLPSQIIYWMRVRLAYQLEPLLVSGQAGELPIPEVAAKVIRVMTQHRLIITLISIIAVFVTTFWASVWGLSHPNGL